MTLYKSFCIKIIVFTQIKSGWVLKRNYCSRYLYSFRIHGIAVSDDASYFHHHCNEMMEAVGITNVRSEDILDIIEGHKGQGYGISTQEELGIFNTVVNIHKNEKA